jgi:hypothetical protein
MIKWNSGSYRGTSGGKKPFIIREPKCFASEVPVGVESVRLSTVGMDVIIGGDVLSAEFKKSGVEH